ncbi:MAG TPA: amino acid-binding protein [Anaeromyxobacteraceae bacterium]|nr:amino acid-binding protein [Anaeromyxobacteraceae bacterium]
MKLRQLSLFLENRPGQLRAPCEALGRAGIDILTMSLADTAQFGILRLIVRDWEQARAVLEAAGMVVNVAEVVPVEVDDRPGGLGTALGALEAAGVGVEYMYAFASGPRSGKAAIVFRFDDADRAMAALRERGLRVLEAEELLGKKSM